MMLPVRHNKPLLIDSLESGELQRDDDGKEQGGRTRMRCGGGEWKTRMNVERDSLI